MALAERSALSRKPSRQQKVPGGRGTMLKLIPLDVCVAAILAATIVLTMIFEPAHAVLITICILLCAYIVVETIRGAPR